LKLSPPTDYELEFIKWRIWEPLRRNQDYRNEYAKLKVNIFLDQAEEEYFVKENAFLKKWKLPFPVDPNCDFEKLHPPQWTFWECYKPLFDHAAFAYKVGWRKEEISSLTWSQVDRDNWIVALHPGDAKNDEAKTVYLDEELKEVFRTQWEARRKDGKLTPYVFPNWNGQGKIKNIITAWKTACKKTPVGHKLFHDLRRTAVRNMIRAGIPERVAMKVSGHKTRSVFDRYNIVNDTDLKLAAQRQEAYLQTQMGTILDTISKIEHFPKKERANQ